MDRLHRAKRVLGKIGPKIKVISKTKFTLSQYAYFSSLPFILLTIIFSGTDVWFYLAATLAFLGMLREILALCRKLWETILGKSVVILAYAAFANFTLSFAALIINKVTGIEPSVFIYTLGFTTLLLLPIWFTLSSVFLLSLSTVLVSIWMLVGGGLRLCGVHLKMHWEDEHYIVFTMLLRILLIPFVMYAGLTTSLPYTIDISKSGIEIVVRYEENYAPSLNSDVVEDNAAENIISSNQKPQKVTEKYLQLSPIVADFIWTFEAYQFSACKKREDQKSVIIDDFSVLLISKDEEDPLGYKFELTECIANYKQELTNTTDSKIGQ